MALHGEVKVNHTVIGDWVAIRQHAEHRDVCEYSVKVTWYGLRGYRHDKEGHLSHNYEQGALVLAAKVLAWAAGMVVTYDG